MPATVAVKVRSDFGRIAATLGARAAAAVSETTQAIAADATANAPFPSIAETISVETTDEVNQAVVVGAWWAGFWEFGTRDFAARPFLTPATERYRTQLASSVMAAFIP